MKRFRDGIEFIRSHVKPEDIGLGAFYYFASAPIIGTMNYAGFSRTSQDMLVFFTCLVVSMTIVHVVLAFAHDAANTLADHLDSTIPSLAACCILLAGLSVLDVVGYVAFVMCAVLTGATCACMVSAWATVPSVRELRPSSLKIAPSLVSAVVFYLIYRCLQFVSLLMANGWQLAVPLIGMVALLVAYSPSYGSVDDAQYRRRSFLLLGLVAVVLSVVTGALGYASNYPDARVRLNFTPMVVFEAVGALVIVLYCVVMARAWYRADGQFSRPRRLLNILAALVPLFVLGCLTGVLEVSGDLSNFLWEASIWVLLLAVLVYGMRTSLFVVNGLAIGIMWESWCMGQMVTKGIVLSEGFGWGDIALLACGVAYLGVMAYQMSFAASPSHAVDLPEQTPSCADSNVPVQALNPLACKYGLSAREAEVLALVGEGRSAKYISEELSISFNTARSHIRHIYEKLDVHSKQELISLIQSSDQLGRLQETGYRAR